MPGGESAEELEGVEEVGVVEEEEGLEESPGGGAELVGEGVEIMGMKTVLWRLCMRCSEEKMSLMAECCLSCSAKWLKRMPGYILRVSSRMVLTSIMRWCKRAAVSGMCLWIKILSHEMELPAMIIGRPLACARTRPATSASISAMVKRDRRHRSKREWE